MEDLILEFECVWNVEKHVLLNPSITSAVKTPEFEIPSIPLTKWILGYYLKEVTEKNCLYVFLKRSSDDSGETVVSVQYQLFITKDNETIACNTNEVSSTPFVKGCTNISIIHLPYPLSSVTPNLTIKCQFFGNKSSIDAALGADDMHILSKDMNNLFENEVIPDFTLKSRNKTIKVHRSVLWARCPSLLKTENLDIDIDPISFKLLLQCIYSGYLDTYITDIPVDLIAFAKKYNLINLQRCMNEIPSKLLLQSCVREYTTSYTWVIRNFDKWNVNEQVFSPLINLRADMLTQWKLIACRKIITNGSEEIDVHLKCVSMDTQTPVRLMCKISLTLDRGYRILNASFCQSFREGVKCVVPLSPNHQYMENNSCDNAFLLKCVLSLSDGTVLSTTSESLSETDENRKSNSYQILANDLNVLFLQEAVSDVTLIVGDSKFPAHKAILAARSPVFSKMFQSEMLENSSNEIIITDVEPAAMFSFLSYIYTTNVELNNVESVSNLYVVADKYEAMVLRLKCSVYLKSHLTIENFNDILIIADMHFDEELKNATISFICNNANKILTRNEWKDLIENEPCLVTEILHDLSKRYSKMSQRN